MTTSPAARPGRARSGSAAHGVAAQARDAAGRARAGRRGAGHGAGGGRRVRRGDQPGPQRGAGATTRRSPRCWPSSRSRPQMLMNQGGQRQRAGAAGAGRTARTLGSLPVRRRRRPRHARPRSRSNRAQRHAEQGQADPGRRDVRDRAGTDPVAQGAAAGRAGRAGAHRDRAAVTVRLALSPLDVMTGLAQIDRARRPGQAAVTDPAGDRTGPDGRRVRRHAGRAGGRRTPGQAGGIGVDGRRRSEPGGSSRTPRTSCARRSRACRRSAEAVLQQSPEAGQEERDRLHLLLVRESRRAGQLVERPARPGADRRRRRTDATHPSTCGHLADAQADRIRVLAPELTVQVHGPALTVWADEAQDHADRGEPAGQRPACDANPTVTSRYRLRQLGEFAELLVTDDGHGVPSADREHIFDRMVRLDTARDRRSGGSGLGLPIARGFARAHGGELTLRGAGAGHARRGVPAGVADPCRSVGRDGTYARQLGDAAECPIVTGFVAAGPVTRMGIPRCYVRSGLRHM